MKITRFELTEVVVPARPDSVNSPEVDHPLQLLPHQGKPAWSVPFDQMPKILIELHTDAGIAGLGEAYRGLGIEQLEPIARELLGADLRRLCWQALPIAPGRAYDGFECAVLDAAARAAELPLHALLGGACRERVPCSYWTGHRTIADAGRKAHEGLAAGFDCIKLKCDLDDPVVAWCEAIREACGPDFRVILDPNQRWQTLANTLARAEQLAAVGNVLCLEDPIPRWDIDGYRLLRQRCPLPIAIHVALPYREIGQTAQDAVLAVRHGACDYFNFNGGIFDVKRLADLSELANVPFWHGSEVDLGVLEASYVHKAAACAAATLPSDIFGRLVREHDLLTEPLTIEAGCVHVPSGAGLGVELDRNAVAQYRTQNWTIT